MIINLIPDRVFNFFYSRPPYKLIASTHGKCLSFNHRNSLKNPRYKYIFDTGKFIYHSVRSTPVFLRLAGL